MDKTVDKTFDLQPVVHGESFDTPTGNVANASEMQLACIIQHHAPTSLHLSATARSWQEVQDTDR